MLHYPSPFQPGITPKQYPPLLMQRKTNLIPIKLKVTRNRQGPTNAVIIFQPDDNPFQGLPALRPVLFRVTHIPLERVYIES